MGLDITAYRGEPVPYEERTPENSYDFHAGSYSGYNHWRDQLAELAGYAPAPVVKDDDSYPHRHAAGVWADPRPGPFVELINFSDCEGTIDAPVSAKLANDFAEYQDRADAHEDEYFRTKYGAWRYAFEFAAINGCVVLH